MTGRQYLFCIQNAAAYADPDTYVSDLSTISIWGDAETGTIPTDRLDALREIYTACHRTVREISAAAGLSNRKLAERFGVPYRTMEDWSRGARVPPIATCLMMQECLGLYRPPVTL